MDVQRTRDSVINVFEIGFDCALCTPYMSHRRTAPVVQKIFMQDVMSLKSAIGEYGNPFLETSSDFLVIATRDIVEKTCFRQCVSNQGPGMSTLRQFMHERLVKSTTHIPEVIKESNVLIKTPHKRPEDHI